jgi:hypothetical protein
MVRLPVSREGVAVREGAGGVAVLCGVAIVQCQPKPGEVCWVVARRSGWGTRAGRRMSVSIGIKIKRAGRSRAEEKEQ